MARATFVVEGERNDYRSYYHLDDVVTNWLEDNKVAHIVGKRDYDGEDEFQMIFWKRADAAKFILAWK